MTGEVDSTENFENYEGSEYSRPIHKLKESLNVNQLVNGVEFEVDEDEQDQDPDLDENSQWWTSEKIVEHLRNEKHGDLIEQDEAIQLTDFDELAKKMHAITDDNGVFKRIIRNGVGKEITDCTSVIYHCEAYLEGIDEPFDSTVLRGRPFKHRLNTDSLINGLLIGLKTMRKHEKAYILVYPRYGYGELGCPPRIPGNSIILYIVEILNVFEEGTLAEYDTLTEDERKRFTFQDVMKMCNEERVSGNTYFTHKKYKEAAFRYRKAIQVLERYTYVYETEQNEANEILLKLYSNAANAFNKIQKPIAAMSYCKRALAINSNHVKALYQYGVAKLIHGNYDLAREFLLKAKKLEPQNESIAKQMRKLEDRVRKDDLVEKELYQKMAQGFKI